MFINMQMCKSFEPILNVCIQFICIFTFAIQHPTFPRPFVNLAKTSCKPNAEARWMSTFRINCMSIAKAVAVRLRRTLLDWLMDGLTDWLTDALPVVPFGWPSVVASFSFQMDFSWVFLSACQSLPGLTFHLSQVRVNSQLLPNCRATQKTLAHRQYIYTHIHTYRIYALWGTVSNSCQLTQIGACCSSLS